MHRHMELCVLAQTILIGCAKLGSLIHEIAHDRTLYTLPLYLSTSQFVFHPQLAT